MNEYFAPLQENEELIIEELGTWNLMKLKVYFLFPLQLAILLYCLASLFVTFPNKIFLYRLTQTRANIVPELPY